MYSKWASSEDIMKRTTKISKDSIINKSGVELMHEGDNIYIDDSPTNNLVVGSAGSGKTQVTMLPQLRFAIKAGESVVVNDIFGELYQILSGELKKENYNIYVLNFSERKGNNYNPFTIPYKLYKSGDKDNAVEMLEAIGYYLISTGKMAPNRDPFWENSAINMFTGMSLYLFENAKEEEINLNSIVNLSNTIDELVDKVKELDKSSLIYSYLSSILFSPVETRGGIVAVFKEKVNPYISKEGISKMMCSTNIDIENIQKEKTAIFIVGGHSDVSRNLIPLFIDQFRFIESLNVYKDRRLSFFIDNFDKLKAFKDFGTKLNISRPNNTRFNIYLNSFLEFENVYGKEEAEIIKMSFWNIIYLLTNDINTLEQISKLCGRKDENTPLITVEELKTFDNFEAIIISPRIFPIKTKLLPDYQYGWEFESTPVEMKNLEFTDIKLYQI